MANTVSNTILDLLQKKIDRRGLLKFGLLASATCLSSYPSYAAAFQLTSQRRTLSFENLHTGEQLKTVYWDNGRYSEKGLEEINYILRDFHNGKIKPVDVRLLDLLYAVRRHIGIDSPYYLLSGYRSPITNRELSKRLEWVAPNSLHMEAKAADILLPGCKLSVLRRVALRMKAGGVGYYPKSNFVHLDVGQVRTWVYTKKHS